MIFSIKKEYLENITGISKKITQGEFQKRDYEYAIIGRMLSPKRMNFREKKSKQPSPPLSLIFKKSCCKFCIYLMLKKTLTKICSIYFWIENPPPPLRNFSANSSVLVTSSVLKGYLENVDIDNNFQATDSKVSIIQQSST